MESQYSLDSPLANMALTWFLVWKTIFQTIVYFILMVLFVYFYMKDQMTDYFMDRTTVTSRIEEASDLQFPTITICMHPAQKPSVAKEFDYMWFWAVFRKNINSTLTLPERFEKLSYIANHDYEIKFIYMTKWLTLQNGLNVVDGFEFEMEPIFTWREGICSKIIPRFQVTEIPFHFYMNISLSHHLNGSDQPTGFNMYLTSNATWNGIVGGQWPQYHPVKQYVNFKENYHEFKLGKITKWSFKEGTESMKKCHEKLAMKNNCTRKCNILSEDDLPPCQTQSDQNCKFDGDGKWWPEYVGCYKTKEALVYTLDYSINQVHISVTDLNTIVYISMWSMTTEVKEEVEVITTADLIGSVGGSCGMFFGFSISAYVLFIMEKILDRISVLTKGANSAVGDHQTYNIES